MATDLTLNISYAGTNLIFCDGTAASLGNGFNGPISIEVPADQKNTKFDVTTSMVTGILVVTVEGTNSVATYVECCDDDWNPDPIPGWNPDPYDPGKWNEWPPYNPDTEPPFNFTWCPCDVIDDVPNSGGTLPEPIADNEMPCSDYVPKNYKQWSKNFAYNHSSGDY